MSMNLDADDLDMMENIPKEILTEAERVKTDLLPEKSKKKYEKEYENFYKWSLQMGNKNFEREEVYLAYFAKLSTTCSAPTLWSRYSMLKTMLKLKKNVDMGKFFKIIAFLKKKMVGYRPKKSKILSADQVENFLAAAPDETYLLIKVATIIGIAGACRREELTNLLIENVKMEQNLILIKIPDNKTHSSRTFAITGEKNLSIIRKYIALRSKNTPHNRFFVNYQNKQCTTQCVGINKFGKMPSDVAAFLKLPNPEQYTGHCYRRSSATTLADAGVNITNLKRHGGWLSTKVAEGYVEESIENKKDIAGKVLKSSNSTATNVTSGDVIFTSPQQGASTFVPTSPQPRSALQVPTRNEYRAELITGHVPSQSEIPENQCHQQLQILPIPSENQVASAINFSANNCNFTINYNVNKI